MKKKDSSKFIIKIILFIISPIIAFIYSLTNIKSKSSFLIFFLFALFFGFIFTIQLGDILDGVRYKLIFERVSAFGQSEFHDLLSDYISGNGKKDLYTYSASYLVSRFTSNYHFVFALYAFIFAFFMLKSLSFLTKQPLYSNSLYTFILTAMIVMSNPIFNINGVRFWTAAWIAVFCILQIYINRDKRYFLLILITPVIHLSFSFLLILLLIGYYTSKFHRLWIALFIISFIFSNVSGKLIESIMTQFLPPIFTKSFNTYLTEDAQEKLISNRGFIQSAFRFYLEPFFINLCVFILYIKRKKIKGTSKLCAFLLTYMTIINFAMPIPGLGTRFAVLSLPLLSLIWLIEFRYNKFKYVIYAYPICYMFNLFISFKNIFRVTEVSDYILPIFYTIYNKL